MHFVDGNIEAARDCNELLHRILGFIAKGSSGSGVAKGEKNSRINMVVSDAGQKRRLFMLKAALKP